MFNYNIKIKQTIKKTIIFDRKKWCLNHFFTVLSCIIPQFANSIFNAFLIDFLLVPSTKT